MSTDDLTGLVRENLVFHNAILEIAGSARLASMVGKVIRMPLVYNSYRWYSPAEADLGALPHAHRRGIGRGDSEQAELIMREHVLEARDVLVSRVPASGAEAGGSR